MRKILAVLLILGACSTPKNENVSLEGPSITEGAAVTTTSTTGTTVPAVPIEVGRWSGAADTDTGNFTVDASWELHWVVTGGAGAAVEWTVPGDAFSTDYLSIEGSGSSLIREGGTFYLSISTFGASYEIWAVDVPG